MPRRRLRAVAAGTGVALGIAVPATLVAQIVDALSDDGIGDLPLVGLTALVVAGAAAGGWVVGRQQVEPRVTLAAGAGLAAITVVQSLGVARRLAAGDDVAWGIVPAVLLLGTAAAALSGLVARASPRT